MTTAIATQNGTNPARPAPAPMPEVMERVVAMGDLSRLSSEDRVAYYLARCEAAGLDPRTQPFQYLQLQGKLTLYASKTATDQLIAIHKLTVEILDRRHDHDLGVFEVHCRVKFPDGHHVEDFAALSVASLRGDALCNALMKTITKAKRRTVLSACGLGMLDETEVETIPGASTIPASASGSISAPDNNSGHATGRYASPEQTAAFLEKMDAYLDRRNGEWLDQWTDEITGECPDGVKELCNRWQADNHLVKWAVQTGRLDPASVPDDRGIKHAQVGRFTAIVYHRSKAERIALTDELARYMDELARLQTEALRRRHPELFGDEPADPADDAIDAESAPVDDEWPAGRE